MSFSEKLRTVRLESNLSQESLGHILNVSRQSITKWENGEAYPDVDNLLQLASKLDISLDYLFEAELQKPQTKEDSIALEAETILEKEILNNNSDKRKSASKVLSEIINVSDISETVKTGIGLLDSPDGGIKRRKVYVLAGPVHIGKTVFSLSIATKASEVGKVIIYTFADTAKDMYSKLLAAEAGIPTTRQYINGYSNKKREQLKSAADILSKKNLVIKEMFGKGINTVREDLSNESEQLSLIVIDSTYGLMDNNDKKCQWILSKIAMDNDCPVIILDRTTSKEYSLEPKLLTNWMTKNWIAEVWILNRKDYYDIEYRREDEYSICELQKYDYDINPIGIGKIKYNLELCRFEDYDEV